MYARLYDTIPNQAHTDDTKYPCPSLPIPGPPFSMYDELTINNREYYQPSHMERHENAPPRSNCCSLLPPTVQRIAPRPPRRTPVAELFQTPPTSTGIPTEHPDLLPVLDCRFNLREICKQCILLEDHLSHDKKRCTDCCIKHFLALEGLCEEAVTLDKENRHDHIRGLAEKIRQLQKMWYENPEGSAHQCSQELRQIRKQFMTDVFPMIFETSGNACGDGMCTLRPRS